MTDIVSVIVSLIIMAVVAYVLFQNDSVRKFLLSKLDGTESGTGPVDIWGGNSAPTTPTKLLTIPSENFFGVLTMTPTKEFPVLANAKYVGYVIARKDTPTEIRPIYQREVSIETQKERMIVTAIKLDIFVKSAITGPYQVDWTLQPLGQIE